MPTKEEMLNSIIAKQAPETVAPEIDETLLDVTKVRRGDTVSVYTYLQQTDILNHLMWRVKGSRLK